VTIVLWMDARANKKVEVGRLFQLERETKKKMKET